MYTIVFITQGTLHASRTLQPAINAPSAEDMPTSHLDRDTLVAIFDAEGAGLFVESDLARLGWIVDGVV